MSTGGETTESSSEIPKELSFDELRKITNDFSNDRKLGESPFGTLYKGIMEDENVIAVKKLDDNNAQIPQLKNEVQKLMALKHENLVRLVGFCSEQQEKMVLSGEIYDIADITANLLCYEYFPDGNLADYLFGTKLSKDFSVHQGNKMNDEFSSAEQSSQTGEDISSAEAEISEESNNISSPEQRSNVAEHISSSEQGIPKVSLDIYSAEHRSSKAAVDFSSSEPSIDWDTRFKIINGICNGLLFLHSLDSPIIHMDLKLQNIWLSPNMVPKIGNFGLSRLFGKDKTKIYTDTVVGSYGYMAPEYMYKGEISTKADIYSLGLLIFEISTGEKNCSDKEQPSGRKYIKKIRAGWTADRIAAKYSSLDAEHLHQIDVCIKTGLECVEVDRRNRPRIEKIVDKLNAS